MSITVLLELQAAEGKADELIALLRTHLRDTRARQGCEGLTVHRDQDEPHTVFLIERWASRADDEAYRAWRADAGAIDGLAALVGGPPSIRYLDDVDA
jgi:quinol monooxygenase YgiN